MRLLHVFVDPVHRLRDGLTPLTKQTIALCFIHRRLPAAVFAPVRAELVQATPEPDREAGRVCGSQSGRLRYLRADDGYAKDVRLELHERVVGDHAAVDLQLGEVDTRVGVDSIEDIARLERDGLERCS